VLGEGRRERELRWGCPQHLPQTAFGKLKTHMCRPSQSSQPAVAAAARPAHLYAVLAVSPDISHFVSPAPQVKGPSRLRLRRRAAVQLTGSPQLPPVQAVQL